MIRPWHAGRSSCAWATAATGKHFQTPLPLLLPQCFPVAAVVHVAVVVPFQHSSNGETFLKALECFPVGLIHFDSRQNVSPSARWQQRGNIFRRCGRSHAGHGAFVPIAATGKHFLWCYHRSDGETFSAKSALITGRMFPRRPDSSNGETSPADHSNGETFYTTT